MYISTLQSIMYIANKYNFLFNPTLFLNFQVDPPPNWTSDSEDLPDGFSLKMCVTQQCEKLPFGSYDIFTEGAQEMTYKDFKMLAESAAVEIFGPGDDYQNVDKFEDIFWSEIAKERIYAINISASLFGDKSSVWNLDKFTKDESCIHSKPSHRFLKVSKVFQE